MLFEYDYRWQRGLLYAKPRLTTAIDLAKDKGFE